MLLVLRCCSEKDLFDCIVFVYLSSIIAVPSDTRKDDLIPKGMLNDKGDKGLLPSCELASVKHLGKVDVDVEWMGLSPSESLTKMVWRMMPISVMSLFQALSPMLCSSLLHSSCVGGGRMLT